MDQHPIPRQITTFEFKLIGVLTVKQFIYLLISVGITVITYFIIVIPYLNFVAAFFVGLGGIAFVFVKYNERSLDIWIKNLVRRLILPQQYYFIKLNIPPSFLKEIYLQSNPALVETHIDANRKLANYIAGQNPHIKDTQNKQNIQTLIAQTPFVSKPATTQQETNNQTNTHPPTPQTSKKKPVLNERQPFISGVIKNNKGTPLPNIMLYIKTPTGEVKRILKTNHNGVFATFHALFHGDYLLEPKDLESKYFFDTITITISNGLLKPVVIISKGYL